MRNLCSRASMPPTWPSPGLLALQRSFWHQSVPRWEQSSDFLYMVDWKYSSKELNPTFGPSSGLWVSQRKVRRGGRTKKKDTHTQPTQKQQEKLFKCQKTFANPTNFAHAHICTASRALFHTKSVGWHYLRSKSCPDIVVGRLDTHDAVLAISIESVI